MPISRLAGTLVRLRKRDDEGGGRAACKKKEEVSRKAGYAWTAVDSVKGNERGARSESGRAEDEEDQEKENPANTKHCKIDC